MNDVKTWAERSFADDSKQLATVYMQAEIAELRAALAARATPAQPDQANKIAALRAQVSTLEDQLASAMEQLEQLRSMEAISHPPPSSVGDAIRALPLPDLPARARLYTSGLGQRQYRRASTMNGPGDPLILKSEACEAMRALLSEAAALAEQVQGQRQGQQAPDLQRITDAIVSMREFYLGMLASSLRNDRADAFDKARHKDITKMVQEIVISELAAAPSIAQDGQKSEGV